MRSPSSRVGTIFMIRVKPIMSKIISTLGASAQSIQHPAQRLDLLGREQWKTFKPALFTSFERSAVHQNLALAALDLPEQHGSRTASPLTVSRCSEMVRIRNLTLFVFLNVACACGAEGRGD